MSDAGQNTQQESVLTKSETSLTRDQIRAKLLGKTPKAETKNITLFGVKLELRQPTLGAIMEAKDELSAADRAADMVIKYAYMPDTEQRVFDDADRDMILKWPFGKDIQKLQTAILELTGVDISGTEEVLKTDPLEGRS